MRKCVIVILVLIVAIVVGVIIYNEHKKSQEAERMSREITLEMMYNMETEHNSDWRDQEKVDKAIGDAVNKVVEREMAARSSE